MIDPSIEFEAMRDASLLRCQHVAKKARRLERELEDAVIEARRHSCSWQEIGDAVGLSRQGAQHRYGRFVPQLSLNTIDNPRRAYVRAQRGWKGPGDHEPV